MRPPGRASTGRPFLAGRPPGCGTRASAATRFTGQPIALYLERNKGPIVYVLRKYDFLLLLPVNPLTRYRDALAPSHAKDDPTDAERQLARLRKHRDQRTPLTPQSPAIRALAQLVEHRRRLGGDNVRITNRLSRTLKHDCPHGLPWLHDHDPAIFCDVLAQWPPLKAAPLARRATLERFFRAHHVRDAAVIEQHLHAIKHATPLTTAARVIVPHALLVQALATQLRVTLHAIEDFNQAMAQRPQSRPDVPLFEALPGAGAVLAPRPLVAFGEQRECYASADELQKSAGMAPVTERRGHTTGVQWRLQCPTCLRQTCVEWAAESIRHSCWARAYDEPQRHKGTSHQAAVRALAFQWMRVVFRCWLRRTPYDEAISLNALQRWGSPLLQHLARSS